MDASAPILLFDSGVGGLTVLDELRKLLPQAPVIYAADIAGLPYGAKSEAEVAARVCGLLGRMAERWQPRLICIACNTASTIALAMVRDVLETPIVGTVPAIKPAAAMTLSGVIGLLGTQATVRQGYVDRLEKEFASGKHLLRHGANGLVALAEAKLRGQDIDPGAVEKELEGLLAQPHAEAIDTLVLACTHFPLLADEIRAVMGNDVALVDGSAGIARRIAALTEGQPFVRSEADRAITTGSLEDLERLRPALAARGLTSLGHF
ncbi:MAG: glutamate racemase [Sphingomonadaceae bacterium]